MTAPRPPKLHLLAKALRRLDKKLLKSGEIEGRDWRRYSNKRYTNALITELLASDQPATISRLGSTELNCIRNYLGIKSNEQKSVVKYIQNQRDPWWWERFNGIQMAKWSGFFPATQENLSRFCDLMLKDMQEVDLLGSWLTNEQYVADYLTRAKFCVLEDLEPFFTEKPWTRQLEGKKVLVVHPFYKSIADQYSKRLNIFPDGLLPHFELTVIPAVQSLGGTHPDFKDWFEALDSMKAAMDAADYEVAIIGAGAYGLPLAAHAKRQGKTAIHLGGATQLLFGIKGRRWEEEYIVWPYRNLMNEHWVRPDPSETPQAAKNVENACYW